MSVNLSVQLILEVCLQSSNRFSLEISSILSPNPTTCSLCLQPFRTSLQLFLPEEVMYSLHVLGLSSVFVLSQQGPLLHRLRDMYVSQTNKEYKSMLHTLSCS
jgi:hypothetical protein